MGFDWDQEFVEPLKPKDLKFLEKVHLPPIVTCNVSDVMC